MSTLQDSAPSLGKDRVRFPRVNVAGGSITLQREPSPRQPDVYVPPRDHGQYSAAASPIKMNAASLDARPQFVPRSVIHGPMEAKQAGIIRDLRLDNIVRDTMHNHNDPSLKNFYELELRQRPALPGPGPGPAAGGRGGMGDISRIAEMQALIEGMAKSNQVILDIGALG